MIDADNWPSHTEELGRKITAVIQRWMTAYHAGKITLKEFYLIVNSVYDTTSGLAPREVSTLLADIEKELRVEAKSRQAKPS